MVAECRSCSRRRSKIYRKSGADWNLAHVLGNLADAVLKMGDPGGSATLYDEARTIFARLGDELSDVWCTLGLSEALHQAGDRQRAPGLYSGAFARTVAIGETRTLAYALSKGGMIRLDHGDARSAEVFLATALRLRVDYLGLEDVART